ncbi:MAG: hypothetical protein PVI23_12350 [Maricaulaceae bacterium]
MNIRASFAAAAAGLCLAVGGCATVNIGAITGDAARRAEATAPAQADLRAASADFEDFAKEASLAEDTGMGGAARRALNVLLHGRSDAEETEIDDPVATFMEARGFSTDEAQATAIALSQDIREARVRVRSVSTAASEVAAGPPRESWERREDLRAAENVVRLARRSHMLFRGVSEQIAPALDRDTRSELDRELAAFTVELDNLSDAADALSAAPMPEEQDEAAPVAVSFFAGPDRG